MRILKSFGAAVCVLVTLAVFATATPVRAQEPHYLQALSELRTARDYINFDHRPGFGPQKKLAIGEIDKAIEEIKHAAWDDGKMTRFAPPSQGVTDAWEPFHQAVRWVDMAKGHILQGVDMPENQGLRERAAGHAAEAHQILIDMLHGQ
jgi:hypothetical protein